MNSNTIEAATVLINEAEGYLLLGNISKGKQSLARGKAILETIIGGVKQPMTPKTGGTKAVGSSALLAALQRRFIRNSQIEKKTAKLMRKKYKAILAHDATIRSETWFCAANVIGDELAANADLSYRADNQH